MPTADLARRRRSIEAARAAGQALAPTIAASWARCQAALDERRSAAVSLQTDVDALLNRMSTYSDILKAKLTEAGASQADISGLLVDARLGASLGIRQAGAETVADVCDYVIKECDLLSGSMSAWRVKDGKIEADDLSVAGRLAGPRVHLEGKLAVLDTMLRQLAQ